jgi:hypothetical protein
MNQRTIFLTLSQTCNESKNYFPNTFSNFKVEILNNSKSSLPNTFTLKLDSFKKLEDRVFPHLKNLQLEEIFSTPPIHLESFTISLYATTWRWTTTLFVTLQTKSLSSKGFSFFMLYKLNPWLLLVLIQCPFSCLVWAHNLLKTTWKQARNFIN